MAEPRPGIRFRTLIAAFFLAACTNTVPAVEMDSGTAVAVKVTVKPDTVYIERSEAEQHVNFDFLVENRTTRDLRMTSIELSAFDADGQLLRRDFIDEFSRRSLELDPRDVLKPNQPSLVFNPFHSFAASLPVRTLRYEFAFASKDRKVRYTALVDVVPVPYETRTALMLPLKGRVLVWDGHDYYSHHRRTDYTRSGLPVGWATNFQRYGYDFVLVNEQGIMYRGPAKHRDDWYHEKADDNERYFAFAQPVHAAGAGRVVAVHDGEPDDGTVDWDALGRRETQISGNYVVIDHQNGEFSWFGHLKQGSVMVQVGQMVQQGEVIAQVGNSGDSIFPHLHYELRTGPGDKGVEGLPSYFSGFRRVTGTGMMTAERGYLNTGDVVENP